MIEQNAEHQSQRFLESRLQLDFWMKKKKQLSIRKIDFLCSNVHAMLFKN